MHDIDIKKKFFMNIIEMENSENKEHLFKNV